MKKYITAITSSILIGLSSVLHATIPIDIDTDVDFSINENVDWSQFSMYSQFGYENEYVFRGQQLADDSFQGFVEANLEGFYTGIWTNLPFANNDNNRFDDEFDFYLGCTIPVNEEIQADVGFRYYWYPEDSNLDINRTREFHVGLSLTQALFTPSVYFYYNTDLQQTLFEFSGSKLFDIGDIIPNTNLSFKGYLGILDAYNLDADQSELITRFAYARGDNNGYVYWGLNADIIYNFTDTVSLIIGVRYSGNNDGESFIDTQTGSRSDNLWWGIAFNAGF